MTKNGDAARLPDVEEDDTFPLDRRRKFDDGTVAWIRTEVTVESVSEDDVHIQYDSPHEGHASLRLLLDYGDARLVGGVQGTLGQFATDGGREVATNSSQSGGAR